ncbi:hypothetical protein TGP89_309920B [Toxoplasma gondii p89]|uniref:Uncharacterized protein n=1 Tax=Toxoplasma gondii p89 TaxID=943119 RepID=A0A086K8J2_TOXGO|nr:hypothetical protein TGP89_309920B [Toxoplasma gondii p89]
MRRRMRLMRIEDERCLKHIHTSQDTCVRIGGEAEPPGSNGCGHHLMRAESASAAEELAYRVCGNSCFSCQDGNVQTSGRGGSEHSFVSRRQSPRGIPTLRRRGDGPRERLGEILTCNIRAAHDACNVRRRKSTCDDCGILEKLDRPVERRGRSRWRTEYVMRILRGTQQRA